MFSKYTVMQKDGNGRLFYMVHPSTHEKAKFILSSSYNYFITTSTKKVVITAYKPGALIRGVTVNKFNPMRMKCDCYVTCRIKIASVMEHSHD